MKTNQNHEKPLNHLEKPWKPTKFESTVTTIYY